MNNVTERMLGICFWGEGAQGWIGAGKLDSERLCHVDLPSWQHAPGSSKAVPGSHALQVSKPDGLAQASPGQANERRPGSGNKTKIPSPAWAIQEGGGR
jgi:hypothetical protein